MVSHRLRAKYSSNGEPFDANAGMVVQRFLRDTIPFTGRNNVSTFRVASRVLTGFHKIGVGVGCV